MPEKNQKENQETKTTFTFTVVLLKVLVVVSILGLIWLIRMLFANGEGFSSVLRDWAWR